MLFQDATSGLKNLNYSLENAASGAMLASYLPIEISFHVQYSKNLFI